jgi:integrase
MRRELLTLWRYAYETDLTETPPLRVMAIKATPRPPTAWSMDTLRKLLDAAEKDVRPISCRLPNVRRCDILPAWISLAYDSGIRLGDILALRKDALVNGCVALTAQKTGKLTVRKLSDYATRKAMELADKSTDHTVFQWALPRKRAIKVWRSFLKENNVSGSPRWLRRSGATYVEKEQPGQASKFLGHSACNPGLAARFYIDASLSIQLPPSPPPIR